MTAGIVRGMASFDFTVRLTQPMEQALFCFRALYRNFQLRGWVVESDELEYREEYVKCIDHLRNTCGSFRDTELITDVVDLLMPMPALRSRPRLLHILRLSCLCLTECTTSLPAIRFQSTDSANPSYRLLDVLLPAQSY